MVCAHIGDVLVITKHNFTDNLKYPGLMLNAKKSFFGCTETEYLGF